MSSRSILVVDDDRMTRESICEIFGDLGCDVSQASGGLQAMEALRNHRRDLLVSDVDMPDISGFELLARLQDAHITCPTVLLSARADARLTEAAKAAGAAELFAKPVKLAPFTTFVMALLAPEQGGSEVHHG